MTDKQIKTIHILMALPASGKTYWAKSYAKGNKLVKHVSLDEAPKKYESLEGRVEKHIKSFSENRIHYSDYSNELILDGLFLTPKDLTKVFDILEGLAHPVDNVTVHYWEENRELCLYNDTGRRVTSSSITIKNGELRKPNVKALNAKYMFTLSLQEHTVLKKSDYEQFKNEHKTDEDVLTSDSWSNGGVSGNCWDDSMSSFGGASALEFDELDNLLEDIKPDLTFLQYKKIKKLAEVETYTEYGYYGSSEDYSRWTINTKGLYELLVEMEIVK